MEFIHSTYINWDFLYAKHLYMLINHIYNILSL